MQACFMLPAHCIAELLLYLFFLFYNKPDISYYGGDFNDRITAYTSYGTEEVYGTSFAAPWISRKMCYLIDVMGMPKEIAKALIIDSAASWDYKTMSANNKSIMGYGVVPIDIRKIVETESDEIRFVVLWNFGFLSHS